MFRLGDIATVTRGFEDPPTFLVRQEGRPALGIGIVMTKGGNIIELGKDVEKRDRGFEGRAAAGHRDRADRRPAGGGRASVGEFVRSFIEALAIVLFVSFLVARLAHRHRGGAVGAAGARASSSS